MYQVIIVIHVLLGLGVIGLVLMQQGKGADAGAAFGTGSSGSVFGAQGAASFLSRATAILATLFFTTSLGLAVLNSSTGAENDLISAPETQQEAVVLPGVIQQKTAEDIPLQPGANQEQPIVAPAVITPPAQPTAPIENLTNKLETQVKESNTEAIQSEPVKATEQQNNESKPVEKPKVVKKVKKSDSKEKATKKTKKAESN